MNPITSNIARPLSPSELDLQRPYSEEYMARFTRGGCLPSNSPVLKYPKGTEMEIQGTPEIFPPFWNYGERAIISSHKEGAFSVPVTFDKNKTTESFRNAAEKGIPVLVRGVVDDHGYLSFLEVKPAMEQDKPLDG